MSKLTEVLTLRITEETKKKIEKSAKKHKWSLSQTAQQVLESYFEFKPDEISYKDEAERITISNSIHKHYEETIWQTAKKLEINEDRAIEYIIDFFERMYPIDI